MSEAVELRDQVAAKDTELIDWVETDVIACNQHPLGWEIWYTGADKEPATPEAVLFQTECIREAWAMAREQQGQLLAAAAGEQLAAAELPDVPESQFRAGGVGVAVRVDDAGCD